MSREWVREEDHCHTCSLEECQGPKVLSLLCANLLSIDGVSSASKEPLAMQSVEVSHEGHRTKNGRKTFWRGR